MEQISEQWFWAAIIGFVVGAVLVWLMSRSSKHKVDADYSALRKEYDKYRQDVNAHFAKTADAVDTLTKSYKDVFTHLSDGAEQLMDKKALQAQLDKRQGKSVTLAYLVDAAGKADSDPKTVERETVVAHQATDKTESEKADTDTVETSKTGSTQETKAKAPAPETSTEKTSAKPEASETAKAPASPTADKPETSSEQAQAADAKPVTKPSDDSGADKPSSPEDKTEATTETKAEETPAEKTPAQKAAEKAGLNVTQHKEVTEESAIESVKRHIRDNNQEKP